MAIGDITGCGLNDSLLLFNSAQRVRGDLCHGIGNFMVSAFSEDGQADITLVSFEVDDCGNIPASVQDTLTVTTASTTIMVGCKKVTDGIFAITYDDDTLGPLVKTFSIDSSGNFDCCGAIDTLDLSAGTSGPQMQMFKLEHADMFCSMWYDGCGDLQVATYTIDGCGNISCVLDTQEIEAAPNTVDIPSGFWTGVGNFYAFSFSRTDDDGFLETWEIDACGQFGCAAADLHEFDTSNGEHISVSSNGNGTLICLYEGVSGGGDLKTITVDACGVMTNGTKIDVMAISGETTDLFRIDETDKDKWLGISNLSVRTWSIDACDVPSQIDAIASILEVQDQGKAACRPGLDTHIVMVGWKISTTEWFAMTLDVVIDCDGAATAIPWGPIHAQQMQFLLGS